MRRAIWLGVAAVGVAAAGYVFMVTSANAEDSGDPSDYTAVIVPVPTGGPTTPDHPLPGADDDLEAMMERHPPVVAAAEPGGPMITQSPVRIP